jgi:WD40 repeat protein
MVQPTFDSSGELIAAGSEDGVVRIWRVATGEIADEFPRQDSPVVRIDLSKNDNYIAAGFPDGVVKVWNRADHSNAGVFTGHLAGISMVRFAGDSSDIISASIDGTVMAWTPERSVFRLVDTARRLLGRCLTNGQLRKFGLTEKDSEWCSSSPMEHPQARAGSSE